METGFGGPESVELWLRQYKLICRVRCCFAGRIRPFFPGTGRYHGRRGFYRTAANFADTVAMILIIICVEALFVRN
jgi:hypothetical protein